MVTPIEKLRDILEKGETQARRNGNVLDGMYISAELARDIISAWPKLCEDAISRQQAIDTAIDAVDNWDGGRNKHREQIIRGALEILPSVQPESEAISKWKKEFIEYVDSLDITRDDWKGIIEYIDELPSAEPDTTAHDSVPAETGKNDGDRTSGDLISRQAVLNATSTTLRITGKENAETVYGYIKKLCDDIKALPSAQPERKTGRWIPCPQNASWLYVYKCSECGGYLQISDVDGKGYKANYCSYCGVKMEVGEQVG